MKGYRGIISKGKFPDAQRRSRRSATLPADAPTTPTRRPAETPTRSSSTPWQADNRQGYAGYLLFARMT